MPYLSKEEIKRIILESNKPVAFDFEDLRLPFGLKRVAGKEIALRGLLYPSFNEEAMSYLTNPEIMIAVTHWCGENFIKYHFDELKRMFIFYK